VDFQSFGNERTWWRSFQKHRRAPQKFQNVLSLAGSDIETYVEVGRKFASVLYDPKGAAKSAHDNVNRKSFFLYKCRWDSARTPKTSDPQNIQDYRTISHCPLKLQRRSRRRFCNVWIHPSIYLQRYTDNVLFNSRLWGRQSH
jgi:hypothetical protein